MVYTHFGLLLWLAAAMTALRHFLTRAAARVAALLDMRRTLVSESMRADERHSRTLAEQLHDGPLQDLLAARLELDEVRERHTDPGLDAAYQAVQDTATWLRDTVTALHPQVLTEVTKSSSGSEERQSPCNTHAVRASVTVLISGVFASMFDTAGDSCAAGPPLAMTIPSRSSGVSPPSSRCTG